MGKKLVHTIDPEPEELDVNSFKALIENAYDGIVLYDGSGVIQYASPSVKKLGGFDPLDLIGKPGTDFVHPDDREGARETFYKILLHPGKSIAHKQRFITKKGNYIWCEYTLTNLLNNRGVNGVVSNFRNIHERKIAEEKAFEAQHLMTTISENLTDGIFLGIQKEEFRYVNKAFLDITGYNSIEELKGFKPHYFFADVDQWKKILAQLEKQKQTKNAEAVFRKKDGSNFYGLFSLSLFTDRNRQPYFVGSIRDISKQKAAETEMLRSQHLLSAISKNISEGIYRSIPDKNFVYANRAFLEMFGYKSIDELNSIKPRDLYVDKKYINQIRDELRTNDEIRNFEALFKKKQGEKFWGSLSTVKVSGEDGVLYYDGIIRDITQQKETELQLLESRNFLNNIMKTVAAPIFVKDERHRWITFNDAFCWFMGKPRNQLLGKTDLDFLPADEAKVFRKIDNQVLKTGDVILNREKITLRGKTRHLLTVKSRYINDRKEKFVIGFITDVTDMKKVEEDINSLNANLQGIMESTQESIYALNKNFNYIAYNNNHARMARILYGAEIKPGFNKLQYITNTPEARWLIKELRRAMKGEHFISEHAVSHNRYRNRVIQTTYNPIFNKARNVTGVAVFVRDITDLNRAQEALNSTNATLRGVIESTRDRIIAVDRNYNYILFNKSHMQTIKRINGHTIKDGENILKILPKDLAVNLRNHFDRAFRGEAFTIEFNLFNRFLEGSVNPIRDSRHKIIGATLFVRDRTNRKRNEERLKQLNETLTQQNWQLASQEEELKATLEELSERNFELDQLMYKTSHDLRSPLSSVLGLLNLLHLDKDPASTKIYLDKIEGRIKKLDEFIRSMLNYARINRGEISYEVIDLERIAQASIKELEYLENFPVVTTSVKIKRTDNALFKSDPLWVKIIFSNIISNAFKYYNPHVKSYLKISIKVTARQAKVIFKDNGIGIEKEYLGKIFDMFYRATEKSQGSGLGMYIVKQAVERLRGTIKVASKFAEGSAITIVLPNY